MKTTQIKGANFLTFFSDDGIKIGNSFYSHKKWRGLKFKDLRNMARAEREDLLTHWRTFDKLYKQLQRED